MPDEMELHDAFEPQEGRWRELLNDCHVHAVLTRAVFDTLVRYKRSLFLHG